MLKLIAVRHGKAAPGDDDLARPLAPQGVEQAKERARSLKGCKVGLLLVSPTARAIETASIVFPNVLPVRVPELYVPADPADKLASDESFSKLGYASPRAYIEADTGWLHRWSWNALRGIYREVKNSCGTPPEAPYVAVVGHAVFSNMIGAVMFPEHAEKLFSMTLGEAEGFVIDARGLTLAVG